MEKKKIGFWEMYKLVEGPLLQQILVQRDAMIPITTKIRVVTKNPMSISLRSAM